jgi:hypothetical protein
MLVFCLILQELSKLCLLSCKIQNTFSTANPFVAINTEPTENCLWRKHCRTRVRSFKSRVHTRTYPVAYECNYSPNRKLLNENAIWPYVYTFHFNEILLIMQIDEQRPTDYGVSLHLFSKLVSAILHTSLVMMIIYFRWAYFTNAGKLNVFRYHSLESEIIFPFISLNVHIKNVSNRDSVF